MSDCCSSSPFHLLVVGGGSAAFAATLAALDRGARVTLVNAGLPIGGTCVNVGCVPSKALLRVAHDVHRAKTLTFDGIDSSGHVVSTERVLAQIQGMVHELRRAKYEAVVEGRAGFTRIDGRARVVGPKAIEVDGRRIEGDAILLATGARAKIPPIPGADGVPPLTNADVFALPELPDRIAIVGAGYIGLEFAQALRRLGVRVVLLEAAPRLLPHLAADVGDVLGRALAHDGVEIHLGVAVTGVRRTDAGVVVTFEEGGAVHEVTAGAWLAATGRAPNTEDLGLEALGVERDAHGFVVVDEHQRTSVPSIYAAGDVTGGAMFVYTAARDGALAARNALGDPVARPDDPVPWVIFTEPQVAGIGLDEADARASGIDAEAATLPLEHVPRAIVGGHRRGFVRLVRDRATDLLVGARIVAPEGGELLMEVALAMSAKIPVADLRDHLHPYLTLSEAIKLAAITFGKDVTELSCCAT